MIVQFSILTPILLAISLGYTLLAILYRDRWSEELKGQVTLFLFFAAVWALGDALIYASADPESQLAWTTLSFVGATGVPVSLFLISCIYVGINRFNTLQKASVLFIIPIISIILVGTNSLHGLFYSGVTEQHVLNTIIWEVSYGPLYPIHPFYSYFLIASSVGILIYKYTASTPLIRRQIHWLFIGIMMPFIANILYLYRIIASPGLDWTPFLLLVTAGILVFGNAHLRLFSIVPLARSRIIESMEDGIIVLDQDHRIVDMNRSATIIAGDTFKDLEGTDGKVLLERWGALNATQSALIHRQDGDEIFEVRQNPLKDSKGTVFGRILFIRDITEVYRARTALQQANKKLNLLSSITRHDILNQITAILGYGSLIEESLPEDPETRSFMNKLNEATRTIQRQITFTADYQNLGVHEPEWQHADFVARCAENEIDLGEITLDCTTGALEVYADPLLQKVFSNLFHNTVKHAEHATRISISFQQEEDFGILIVEDNGIGIPDRMKERIFTHIRGSQIGLGLYLIREILSITNITISEDGRYGDGARFLIRMPKNSFRNAPDSDNLG
ncbi:MAG: histidine kinase N-terminal 7TM domain-containing protein [Methanocalculus sp.]|uniref:histidine kinase N-terminal 7TM domain-containing protein n=1 Tax=Methanocalculus sp. TaxID=2004547 RepID=UPI00271C27E8|nr:histidine kinase N-terminal 7TM domain-containing protein [Methanocalculus sp.]MDO9538505.1 histidine kinase N-terminal 7TM domain-containing protein [Methanocalculus sp.]